ncbi:unnamed protein product [Protopolystoma xenopodis]|uniref:Uncharacterized protein n=1 Tax=Protopolystoma xenopodis TaxID=117903 RepID=A0A448XNP4_9PLAT|nr:unnamed protein product [Protopolystoma xenopodis]
MSCGGVVEPGVDCARARLSDIQFKEMSRWATCALVWSGFRIASMPAPVKALADDRSALIRRKCTRPA